jgi:hypothetical protein
VRATFDRSRVADEKACLTQAFFMGGMASADYGLGIGKRTRQGRLIAPNSFSASVADRAARLFIASDAPIGLDGGLSHRFAMALSRDIDSL